jgi:hypothetical protein
MSNVYAGETVLGVEGVAYCGALEKNPVSFVMP